VWQNLKKQVGTVALEGWAEDLMEELGLEGLVEV